MSPTAERLVAELSADGRQRTLVDGLNMPIDVAVDAAGDVWILEHSRPWRRAPTASATCTKEEASGRLSRINAVKAALETVLTESALSQSPCLPHPDGGIYTSAKPTPAAFCM